jgi:hypothetical protein
MTMPRGTGIALLLCLATAELAMAQARVAIDLNTHSEVTIDRSAAAIWPHIVDPSGWKQGARLRRHAGPAGEVGEVFAAQDPGDTATVSFFVENVELEPSRRRTIKLSAPAGALVGYASWTLRETAGRTVVQYDVYSETLLDAAQAQAMTPAQLAETERSSHATNKARFDQELLALKRLVEAGR